MIKFSLAFFIINIISITVIVKLIIDTVTDCHDKNDFWLMLLLFWALLFNILAAYYNLSILFN